MSTNTTWWFGVSEEARDETHTHTQYSQFITRTGKPDTHLRQTTRQVGGQTGTTPCIRLTHTHLALTHSLIEKYYLVSPIPRTHL